MGPVGGCPCSPDVAEPELGTTSPLLLIIGILSPNPQAGFVAYWLILWAIGGVGMLALAKHLGSPLWGAWVVALGYTASGFYTGHAEHTSSLCSIAYLPWIIWRFDRALQTKKYWFAVQAGILFGLSTLGGYPQLTILTPGFLALWLVGRVLLSYEPAIDKDSRARSLLRASIFLALTVGIGLVICSPAYVAIFNDTPGYSDRVAARSRAEAISSNLLPAGALTTLASPFIALLNLQAHPVWPVSDVSMINVYLGAGALYWRYSACGFASAGESGYCSWQSFSPPAPWAANCPFAAGFMISFRPLDTSEIRRSSAST